MGHFYFKLCNLDGNGGRESEACFDQNTLRLTNGSDRFTIQQQGPAWFDVHLQLPWGVRCNHCVLQWTYVAGEF